MTKVLDTIGTLQLIDTGRRCAVRNVRILRVHCAKNCSADQLMHDAIATPYWETMKLVAGYHQGCDPASDWRRDPVGTKLKHDALRSLLDRPSEEVCVACGQTDCTGAGVSVNN
jgi:hypothetical protein